MNLETLLSCSRKLLFENDLENFEYSARGTVFLCRFRNRLFAVTAGHVIEGFDASAARVMIHAKRRDFLAYDYVAMPWARHRDDPDYCDLAIFVINESTLDVADFRGCPPVALHDAQLKLRLDQGRLIFRGFPTDETAINYEESRIRFTAVTIEGRWAGPAPIRRCHKISLSDVSPCESLDGFSGSPVFWVGDHGSPPPYAFAGVLIRGTHGSKTAHFIDRAVLLHVLQRLVSGSGLTVLET